MAAVNVFERYGVKEVANVYFEALADEPNSGVYQGDIVLFLDSLKVSTIETTAENVAAQGGWGNPKLVQWDYGKEINVTLEDALISLESLRFMMGGAIHRSEDQSVWISRSEEVEVVEAGIIPLPKDHLDTSITLYPEAHKNHPIRFINYGGGKDSTTAGCRTQVLYKEDGTNKMTAGMTLKFKNDALGIDEGEAAVGDRIRIFWDEERKSSTASAVEVTISPSTFPGTYKVVGDTFIRSEATGKDEAFQFIIEKAKVQSNVTLTLQAEGDPATFEMTLNVLRASRNGENEMMRLVRYDVGGGTTGEIKDDHGSLASGS